MARKQVLRNIGMLALAAALCIGLLALPTRDAQAAAATSTVTVTGSGTTCTFGGNAPTYTANVTLNNGETVIDYSWSTDGTCFTGSAANSGVNSFTPGIDAAGTGTVTCNVRFNDSTGTGCDAAIPASAQATVNKAAYPVGITNNGARTIKPGDAAYAPLTVTDPAGLTMQWHSNPTAPTGVSFSADGAISAAAGSGVSGAFEIWATGAALDANHDDYESPHVTVTIAATDPNLTLNYTNLALKNGESQIVNATWAGGATMETPTFASSPVGYITNTPGTPTTSSASFTINAVGDMTSDTGSATLTVSIPAYGAYKAATKTCTISASKTTTVISGVPTSVHLSTSGSASSRTYSATSNSGATLNYAFTNITAGTANWDATSHTVTAAQAGTAQVTVSQAATATHTAASVTSNIEVAAAASTISSSSAALTSVGGKGTTTISVDFPTEEYTFAVASNSNPLVASVRNTAVTGTSATFEVTAYKAGATQIVLSAKGKTSGTSLTSQTYYVNVTLPASSLSLDSWYDNLYKNRKYTEITAYVNNPGSTLDEGSAVEWWVDDPRILDVLWYHDKVQRDGNTYFSRVRMKALRSGTTYVHVRMADGSTAVYKIVTHMGSYIPQTGQDSTAIYVVGALLLLSATATAFVYGKRRRNRS